MSEQIVNITVFGKRYSFKTDANQMIAGEAPAHLQKEIERTQKLFTDHAISGKNEAVLLQAALNMAGENLELRNKYTELVQYLHTRTRNILSLLEKIGMDSNIREENL